jgi:hypothetical protein
VAGETVQAEAILTPLGGGILEVASISHGELHAATRKALHTAVGESSEDERYRSVVGKSLKGRDPGLVKLVGLVGISCHRLDTAENNPRWAEFREEVARDLSAMLEKLGPESQWSDDTSKRMKPLGEAIEELLETQRSILTEMSENVSGAVQKFESVCGVAIRNGDQTFFEQVAKIVKHIQRSNWIDFWVLGIYRNLTNEPQNAREFPSQGEILGEVKILLSAAGIPDDIIPVASEIRDSLKRLGLEWK